jgi:hypothetical protein
VILKIKGTISSLSHPTLILNKQIHVVKGDPPTSEAGPHARPAALTVPEEQIAKSAACCAHRVLGMALMTWLCTSIAMALFRRGASVICSSRFSKFLSIYHFFASHRQYFISYFSIYRSGFL